jgi:hypothetical protein|tara:strand:- start:62567 stop:62758 length:192 start_codon:yes stop_codon:yes gene_type:complete
MAVYQLLNADKSVHLDDLELTLEELKAYEVEGFSLYQYDVYDDGDIFTTLGADGEYKIFKIKD